MSSSHSVVKTLYCKKAQFLKSNNSLKLQELLLDSLKELKFAKDRRETIGENSLFNKVILSHVTSSGILCGIFASYERGTAIATVVENDSDESVDINHLVMPKLNDREQELLEGICIFGVYNNNIVLIPSRTLKSKDLELHFNWLLLRTNQLKEDNRVHIAEQVTKDLRDRLKVNPVNSITLGDSALNLKSTSQLAKLTSSELVHTSQVSKELIQNESNGWIKDLISTLISSENSNNSDLMDALEHNITVALTIKFSKDRSTNENKVIENLAIALRNLDADDVTLGLKGGNTLAGSELKLSKKTTISSRDGILESDKAFEAIRNYLSQLIKDKIIDAI